MDYKPTPELQKWWTANYAKMRNDSSFTKATIAWNAATAAASAAAPQVVADERYSSCLATIRDLDRISMKFAADLTGLPVVEGSRMRNVDYLVRHSVLELVATWRSEWDENSLQRMPIDRAALQAAPVQPVTVPDGAVIKAAQALLDEHKAACLTDPMYALIEMADDDEEASVSAALLADLFRALNAAPSAQGVAEDAERLRWLAETGARISWSMDGEYCAVWLHDECDGTESRPAEGYPLKCYDIWHRAIDAAIATKAAA